MFWPLSFRNRIALTFTGLMLLVGGLNLGLEWLVLNRHRQVMVEQMNFGWTRANVDTIDRIGWELVYQTMAETCAVVTLMLMVGLGLLGYIMRRFTALYHSAAALDGRQLAGGLHVDDSIRCSCDEIGRLADLLSRMSERIASQDRDLSEQYEQRRELVANVSHDLRTPLASMQGYLETLLRKFGQLTVDEQRHFLEIAVRQSRRAGYLAGRLFELAGLEDGDALPRFERFPLQELVHDVMQKFVSQAGERNIRLVSGILPSIPPVTADIGMIERVLCNLLDNAVRHTPPAGTVGVEMAYVSVGKVNVTVRNSGAGISVEDLQRLFERESPLRRDSGRHHTGLGLLIVKRIVELHGGTVTVVSTVESGTAFSFTLDSPP